MAKLTFYSIVFTRLAAGATPSFINAPGCLPDEVATVVSESIYPVVLQAPPVTGEVANLTLTFYTCPSRQADGGGTIESARVPNRC
ncbi:hypothetical protein B0H16DRAFT_1527954 [Mycena metata]|uniref:Uncharacterized protein n=1 Tax=Mycena metata TaxID=1033252 RepID=A0AAD7JHI7_9AGAR|nr:hypothetical protein B0H16DRAFT_1527954 [Mycena metata]